MKGFNIVELFTMQQDTPGFSFDWMFILGFIVLEVLLLTVFFYYSEPTGTTGPLGLRNVHMKPFVVGLLTVSIGIIMGFFYVSTVGFQLDIFNSLGLTTMMMLIGISFGFLIFMKKYRKGNR